MRNVIVLAATATVLLGGPAGLQISHAPAASAAETQPATQSPAAPVAGTGTSGAPSVLAATAVCTLFCDTRDPSQARQDTFPVPQKLQNDRRIQLHVSDVDGMGWASIDDGTPGDSIWLDRSWDGGATWDGLLGKASIPSTWTGTRTLMYNISDPANHRRGLLRACGDAAGVACTEWVYPRICNDACDGVPVDQGSPETPTVPETTLDNRHIALHVGPAGMAWATLTGGRAGDEVWMDRSWDGGASWPGGSSLGRVGVATGATSVTTVKVNTTDPKRWLYGGAVRACGRAVEGANGSCTAWARLANVRADAAADALMYSYDTYEAWWRTSWWNSAATMTGLIDYMRKSGNRTYLWAVERTFQVNRGAWPAGQRSSDQIWGDFTSRAIDDGEWWALTWIDAYDLTGNQAYLAEAVTIANYTYGYWDSTCGGGVWWDGERTYKNAVTNGLWIRLTAALHNRLPGDTLWLGRATAAWTWFRASGMINSSNLVNDGLNTGTCANNGQTVHSYNQGLAVGAAVEMWRATGNATALDDARRLATAGTTSPVLVSGGVLTEACDAANRTCDDNGKQFKGIFMRYIGDLDTVTGGAYKAFIGTQANALWNLDRDTLNRFGCRWSGLDPAGYPNVRDWRTQASALEALVADL